MNSLNILSARVSPPQTPVTTRRNSYGYGDFVGLKSSTESGKRSREHEQPTEEEVQTDDLDPDHLTNADYDEKPVLLDKESKTTSAPVSFAWYSFPQRIASTIIEFIWWILSMLAAPGVYLIACLYNENGYFSPLSQLGRSCAALFGGDSGKKKESNVSRSNSSSKEKGSGLKDKGSSTAIARRLRSSNSSSSGLSSESESDRDGKKADNQSLEPPSRHTRSRSAHSSDEIAPARRSIRIKLHNEDSLRQRRHRKSQSTSAQSTGPGGADPQVISPATLKSPTSPASSLVRDKYPRAPAPPRPLIPRRQPSYTLAPEIGSGRMAQKTLVLDLDETLIHSMAKGGRMSTGHMVEVKLNTYVGMAGNASAGPQHPILYYVHKRPHCDDFLRRVSSLPDPDI
jgi:CTD nuclear envelope phosphatase 1